MGRSAFAGNFSSLPGNAVVFPFLEAAALLFLWFPNTRPPKNSEFVNDKKLATDKHG